MRRKNTEFNGLPEATETRYVLYYISGSYEDKYTSVVAVYEDKSEAEEFIKKNEEKLEYYRNLAIKDEYGWEYEDKEDRNENAYSDLMQEFENYAYKITFGDKSEDLFTDEDWLKYDGYNSNENFKKFMMEQKGISEEVAEATIIFNENGFYGENEYDKSYYIQEIPYYKKKQD